ncbi:MAG: hypothetical protein WCA11_15695 [Terracidiphilus sp.]
MLNLSLGCLCGFALLVSAATASASAAAADSDLLRLVPGGAQIVSGISDPGTTSSTGRLLVVTENNNRDYDDCLALLGADAGKAIKEVIEAAASSHAGDLGDHLLLMAGRFDRFAILKAALENGSTRVEYNGEQVLVVKPFDREKNSMNAVRWLAVLKNRVLVFGVPGMVARTLDRYERNEPADTMLLQRIARLPPDVNSWSIVAMAPQMLTAHLALESVPASLETMLKNADEVELGIHYGRTARINFSIHTRAGDLNGGLLSRAQPILASFTPDPHSHLQIGMEEPSRLNCWMTVPEKQFDQWLAAVASSRSGN